MPEYSTRSASRRKTSRRRPRSSPKQPDRAAIELGVLQAFRTIFASARSHDAEVRRVAGIPGSQLWALSEIARTKAMRVNDLSERMALHQTTASNLVNALVERKLIRRARDATDQRVVRLHITSDGKRVLLRAPGPYTGLLVDALRHLGESELGLLDRSLAQLVHVLRGAAVGAGGQTLLGE